MKRKHIWALAIAAVVLTVLGVAIGMSGPKGVPVQVAKAGKEDLEAKVSANGKVQAVRKADLSAPVFGQVTHIAVKEGDEVKKGQLLLIIDPAQSKAMAQGQEASMQALMHDLEAAKARLLQARADFKRAESNHEAHILSDADFDNARTVLTSAEAGASSAQRRVDQARAGFAQATDTLSKNTLRAPMDGVITAKRVEEGEMAVIGVQNQPGTVLFTISDMSKMETEMEVDETSIPAVKLGQSATVRIDAYPNKTFDGVVTEVGDSPIIKTGSDAIKFLVKVQIKNPPEDIKPGLSAQADILTGSRTQTLAVPIQALVTRPVEPKKGDKPGPKKEEEGVYLMEAGKVKFQPVKTGLMGELSAEVVDGLKGGETIITGPFRSLRTLKPGDKVRVEKPKPGGEKKDEKA